MHVEETTTYPVALTIAGSDSGGGAGVQADLKTFEALDVFGTSAITCVTAQNPDEVAGIVALDPEMVCRQIETVCRGFPVAAIKTGMLYSAEMMTAAAQAIAASNVGVLVVDPVMVSTSGTRLLREDAQEVLCSELLPLASVVTPNLPEAEALCGRTIDSLDDLKAAARALSESLGVACVLKGGHLHGNSAEVVDVLCHDGCLYEFSEPSVEVAETHGTGCTFSAALAGFLTRGMGLVDATGAAKKFVWAALQNSIRVGTHSPLRWKQV